MEMSIDSFRDEYYFLSNFYNAKIVFNGITYGNAESAYQAQKCVNDFDRILFCNLSGKEAKKKGRNVKLRSDWEDIKVSIMSQVVEAKFVQNPYLIGKLLSTGNRPLIEGNPWGDTFWGISNGEGFNMLGRILMDLRDRFHNERK